MTKRGNRKRFKDQLYLTLFREAAVTIDHRTMRQLVADLHLAGPLPDADIDDGQAELASARVCRRMRALFLFEAEDPRELADLAAGLMALDGPECQDLARHTIATAGTEIDPLLPGPTRHPARRRNPR